MPDIDLDAGGIADLDRRLGRFVALLTDLRPFWPMVVPLFIGWEREQFATEGAWGGDPWAELSPRYAAWKMRHFPGKGILIATGELRGAASSPSRDATPTTLTLTIDSEKVGWHQGSSRAKGMPRRPVVPDRWPPQAERELEDALEEYVHDAFRRSGLEAALGG